MYAAMPFEKGDWIVFVRWYVFDPSKSNDDGDRFYRKGRTQYIPCESIVQGVRSEVKLPWVGRHCACVCPGQSSCPGDLQRLGSWTSFICLLGSRRTPSVGRTTDDL